MKFYVIIFMVLFMINNGWDKVLNEEYEKNYFIDLIKFIDQEYSKVECYPLYNDIFNALKYTDYQDVKVVILGQDPYHGYKEAHGFSFSVLNEVRCPPSLINIFKELKNDLGITRVNNELIDWAKQGVLLLNSILTVEANKPLSHKDCGWELFTDAIIKKINEKKDPVVFILWGSFARSKKNLINNKIHYIIESVHPSPLSAYRGFFGSSPFSKTNDFLIKNGLKSINW